MEKYSQFRDKGTGIAPFFPIPTTPSGVYLPFHIFLFAVRVPLLITVAVTYFLVLQWLPIGSLGKKAALWSILGVPGIWWVDLQIDGVRRGSLATTKASSTRLPQPSSIIASSSTSPLDALYLAAIFDPIITVSYPGSRLLRRTTLLHSIISALLPPSCPPNDQLTTAAELIRRHPSRTILVFPECTTTNGRAIIPLSPSMLSAPKGTRLYPISLRYAAPDITTPVPGWQEAVRFLWNLCSRPTHTIRVRVAEAVIIGGETYSSDGDADAFGIERSSDDTQNIMGSDGQSLTFEERSVLDKVGEALARLGRVKRVNVGVPVKQEFIKMWSRRRK